MRAELRRVTGFALRFVPTFLILVGAYLLLLPWYRSLPEAVANSVMEHFDPATRIDSLATGGWQAYRQSSSGDERAFISWQPFVVHLLFLNLALLPALVFATPLPMHRRLRLVAWSVPLLLLVQVLALTGLVRGQLCLQGLPDSFLCLWLLRLVYASGQLSSAALWALLTWRFWLPGGALDSRARSRVRHR